MNKWIDERAWKNSLYICYALSIIIVITAGYNYTLNIIGDTTSLMKVVWLICVCLFVAFGIFLGISVIITPLSELIYQIFRLILYSVSLVKKLVKKLYFRLRNRKEVELDIDNTVNDINFEVPFESAECKKEEDVNKMDEVVRDALNKDFNRKEVELDIDNTVNDNYLEVPSESAECKKEEEVNKKDEVVREASNKEFTSSYVKSEYKDSPIYDVLESLFIKQKSGAFAAHAFKFAKEDLNLLIMIPGYEAAKRLFPYEDAISGSCSNYSNALHGNYSDDLKKNIINMIKNELENYNVVI